MVCPRSTLPVSRRCFDPALMDGCGQTGRVDGRAQEGALLSDAFNHGYVTRWARRSNHESWKAGAGSEINDAGGFRNMVEELP